MSPRLYPHAEPSRFPLPTLLAGALAAAAPVWASDPAGAPAAIEPPVQSQPQPPTVKVGALSIDAPYARAVPPGQPNSAVFLRLTNASSEDRALVEAASPAAETVELHTHLHQDGMMVMRRVDAIPIPGGAVVELKPGGLHIMLIGLHETLSPGGQVDLTLRFDDASEAQIQAPVREVARPMPRR